MGESLADWLRLREPLDRAARDEALVYETAAALGPARPIRVVDLGTGTGSNFRYLAPRLPAPQSWVLVDKDPALLREIVAHTGDWAESRGLQVTAADGGFSLRGPSLHCTVELWQRDLDLPLDARLFAGRHLVTASALLDLVSDVWLRALAAACRRAGAAVLFALTYDGRTSFEPREAGDDVARALLNAHQLRDKGLGGPAAGPGAHMRAVHWFRDLGYVIRERQTDWEADTSAADFQRALIAGLAAAAIEQAPEAARLVADWRVRRLAHVDAGRSRVLVGHRDLAAWLDAGS